jgi:hypothetical protein
LGQLQVLKDLAEAPIQPGRREGRFDPPLLDAELFPFERLEKVA